jgi:hypothetical protein
VVFERQLLNVFTAKEHRVFSVYLTARWHRSLLRNIFFV